MSRYLNSFRFTKYFTPVSVKLLFDKDNWDKEMILPIFSSAESVILLHLRSRHFNDFRFYISVIAASVIKLWFRKSFLT